MNLTHPRNIQIVLSLAGGLILSSCAVPAKLQRIRNSGRYHHPYSSLSEHQLLTIALKTPNEGESANALAHFVQEWRGNQRDSTTGIVSPAPGSGDRGEKFRVVFTNRDHGSYLPSYFDQITPAADYRVKRIEHHRREGIGTPLLAVRENTGRSPVEQYFPPEGITRDVTAVLYPGRVRDGVREVRIELLSSLSHTRVRVEGKSYPLAGDFSVSWAALIERSGALNWSEVGDVIFQTMPKRDPHLFLMEEYDPDKEPVIMIHGLLGSPLVWARLSNELRSDPEFRKRYQIWHFLYNSSAPAFYSGRFLRQQMGEVRSLLDPGLNDPAMQRTTLIAHSMGGVVARGLISDPGQDFWNESFTRPLADLKLSREDREQLQDTFFWKPVPYVHRIIFVCTPHRGTDYVNNPVGNLGKFLVQPPDSFTQFYARIAKDNPGAFTDDYTDLASGKLDSVGALAPDQPTLKLLSSFPVRYPVKMHSIIADRGKNHPLEDSSDGLVPYWSSHLEEAVSEKVVPYGHGAYDKTETIREVARILLTSP